MNVFEEATQLKLRFDNPRGGTLLVEDLWDLPLKSGGVLDVLAQQYKKELDSTETDSFINPKTDVPRELTVGFEILKHVIAVKQHEVSQATEAAAKKQQKDKLMGILAQKEEEKLHEMSAEEIREMLNKL